MRQAGREVGRQAGREGGRQGGREAGSEGMRQAGREGGRGWVWWCLHVHSRLIACHHAMLTHNTLISSLQDTHMANTQMTLC